MKFKPAYIIVGIVFIVILGYVLKVENSRKTSSPHTQTPDNIHVVTSIYPLYFFASQIGGDKIDIKNITPSGAEPHDYEPSTRDISEIEKSDLLIVNGGNLEPWADKIIDDLKNKKVAVVIAGGADITQEIEEAGKLVKDPHVWLDPVLAKKEVEAILQAFNMTDNSNIAYYETHAKQLEEKLDALGQEFREGLKSCSQKNIVTSHTAFGYLASRYGLKQMPISGLSPEEEPSPQKLAEIVRFVKEKGVRAIFFETLVSPRQAETIAKEAGVDTLVLNPLEGLTKAAAASGQDYISIQRQNLHNLQIALDCQ